METPATYTTKCKLCKKEIKWVTTENGKVMPVDATPEKRVVNFRRGRDDKVIAKVVDTFIPHFATCPNYVRCVSSE